MSPARGTASRFTTRRLHADVVAVGCFDDFSRGCARHLTEVVQHAATLSFHVLRPWASCQCPSPYKRQPTLGLLLGPIDAIAIPSTSQRSIAFPTNLPIDFC
eukprot:scaffold1438_cov126-Isochrysis_galbana.AAC.5